MRAKRGVVLFEVMVALAILGVAGVTLIGMAGESVRAIGRAEEANRVNQDADDFFAAVSIWSVGDLDRRLGARRQGQWVLVVQREAPRLYTVALVDAMSRRLILETALFRPEIAR